MILPSDALQQVVSHEPACVEGRNALLLHDAGDRLRRSPRVLHPQLLRTRSTPKKTGSGRGATSLKKSGRVRFGGAEGVGGATGLTYLINEPPHYGAQIVHSG